MKIRVPASSANLGPGFDSCGIALSHYLTLEVLEDTTAWRVEHDLGESVPTDKENLIVKTALDLAPNLKPKHLKVTSSIPMTKGLGSSSSAVVAGIELANRLGQLGLSQNQKLLIATKIEGHPDNVAPAIYGGFVVASFTEGKVYSVKHRFPDCDVIAYIPEEELETEKSRNVLPKKMDFKTAVSASSIANVLIAAVLEGNLPLVGQMAEKDLFHEDARKGFIPHLAKVRAVSQHYGGYGSFLSGAGPTILILSSPDKTPKIVEKLNQIGDKATVDVLNVEYEGTQVF